MFFSVGKPAFLSRVCVCGLFLFDPPQVATSALRGYSVKATLVLMGHRYIPLPG